MLENSKHRADLSNSSYSSLRKAWIKFWRSFFPDTNKVQRGLQELGEPGVSRRMDEEILQNFSSTNQLNMEVQETREDYFAKHKYEWVKTERSGDVCAFKEIVNENGTEYIQFTDNSRIRTDLIGDIVLMYQHESEILGEDLRIPVGNPQIPRSNIVPPPVIQPHAERISEPEIDPVYAIIEKTKKKTHKLGLTLTVKIPSPELYAVIRENFENTDEVLLESVMEQVHESLLKDAVKRELHNIYSKRKKS